MFLTTTTLCLPPMHRLIRLPTYFWEDLGAVRLKIPINCIHKCDMNPISRLCKVWSESAPAFAVSNSQFLRVIFKNTIINVPLNKAIWSPWTPGDPRTGNVYFAAFNSTGAGISGTSHVGFSAELTSNQAEAFTIPSTVGYDYKNWVDPSYVV